MKVFSYLLCENLLLWGIQKGRQEVFEWICKNEVYVNPQISQKYQLFFCEIGNFEFVKYLLKNEVNLQDDLGNTPIYLTCQKGDLEITRYLVEMGADINHESTPSHILLLF